MLRNEDPGQHIVFTLKEDLSELSTEPDKFKLKGIIDYSNHHLCVCSEANLHSAH